MKKLALLLSALALGALGLTACGGGDDDEATAASEADPARRLCRVPLYRLAVNQGDISCRAARRVILDLANNRLPGSWSCTGQDADVLCTKEPWASSRIVITARFASVAAAVEADPGTILSDEEVIGRKANEWARLFATDALAACRYYAGGQPACERAACQRVGHTEPIKNCRPPSSEFRESFADATVERVVLARDHHATAEFSNGESVEFEGPAPWYITERWVKRITRSHGTGTTHRLSEERIEQKGNKWAAAFAAGRATCRYMGQPACERATCKRLSDPIKNCTPPSQEFRESFAGTVERVVIGEDHRHARAEFSNGESVEFEGQRADEGDKGEGWGNWAYFITERWIKNAGRS